MFKNSRRNPLFRYKLDSSSSNLNLAKTSRCLTDNNKINSISIAVVKIQEVSTRMLQVVKLLIRLLNAR